MGETTTPPSNISHVTSLRFGLDISRRWLDAAVLKTFTLAGVIASLIWPLRTFCLWCFIEELVYKRNYENLNQLRTAIVTAIQQIFRDMLFADLKNFVKGMSLVIECNGSHIELQ